MPRAKRPLAEVSPNEQVAASSEPKDGKPKRQRVNAKTQFEQSAFDGQYEYACIGMPPWAEDKDPDERDREDEASQLVWKKPASEHPEWKWIMLRESFDLLDTAFEDTDNRDPDTFGIYVYNDFLGYGIIEVIENMLKAFNKELKPQKGKQYNYQQMWAIATTLANYINREASMPWMMVDDSDRCERLHAMFGCLILTALNELDRIGQLKADSKFLDLGHVIALYLLWSKKARSTDIVYPTIDYDSDEGEEPETVNWQEKLVAYGKKAQINLLKQGVDGIDDVVKGGRNAFLGAGNVKVERWKWTAMLREYRNDYLTRRSIFSSHMNNIGGDDFDISKWEPEKKAKYSFDRLRHHYELTDEDNEEGEAGEA